MPANRYKVPVKQWRKWCNLSRRVFNGLYTQLRDGGDTLAPCLEGASDRSIRVVAWNAAWLAADQTESGLRTIAGGK